MANHEGYGIYGDIEEFEELVKGIRIGEEALKKATVRSVNDTARSCIPFLSKKIREDYNIKARDIKATLRIKKANYSNMEAVILGKGKHGIPLSKFSPTPKRIPSTIHKPGVWKSRYTWWGKRLKGRDMVPGSDKYLPKKGIKVLVRKGQRKVVRNAFVAQMPSGHIGVFRRMGKGLGKWWDQSDGGRIEELFGPSPIRIMESDHIQIPLDDFAGQTLDKNIRRHADYYLKKAGLL